MIEGIVLNGFRSFGEEVQARFAPITLIYGPNSAGKSSLVKSLQFLRQSALVGQAPFFRFDGPFVDLGTPLATVHRHSSSGVISLHLDLGLVAVGGGRFRVCVGFEVSPLDPAYDRFVFTVQIGESEERVVFSRIAAQPEFVRLADARSRAAFDRVLYALRASEPVLFERADEGGSSDLVFSLERLVPVSAVGRLASRQGSRFRFDPDFRPDPDAEAWMVFARRVSDAFARSLDDLSYLGPLRRPWSRAEPLRALGSGGGVGPAGEDSIAVLASRPEILAQVNESLSELESGYELEISTLSPSESLQNLAPHQVVPSLHHIASGVRISPSDAGFGLSQLLPIVVEMHHRQRSMICIEQPELHLHPRLQARFGQLLRDAVSGRSRNRFLVETHSEHLLLRIQRLVREGMLDPDEVSILYVDNQRYDETTDSFHSSISSTVIEIRIDTSGSLLDPWPGGFFGERWEEWQ